MKKLLLSLIASAFALQFAAAQQISITYGSFAGLNAMTFTNADSIAIGFLDGDTFTSFDSATAVPGPLGVPGYANATWTSNSFTNDGESAIIQVTAGTDIGYVSSSTWTALASSASPAPPTGNTFTLIGSDASILSLTNMVVDPGTTALGGLGLSVVPEPSTYALLAGFAAFIFVAIRRRNS